MAVKQKKTIEYFNALAHEKKDAYIDDIIINAYNLIQSAQELIRIGNYGHAFFLLETADEELAKVMLVQYPDTKNLKNDPFINHGQKREQISILTYTRFFSVYLLKSFLERSDVKSLTSKEGSGKKSEEHEKMKVLFNKHIQKFLELVLNDPETKKRFEIRNNLYGLYGLPSKYKGYLTELRQYSIYVDIPNPNEILTPAMFDMDLVKIYLEIVKENLYYMDSFRNNAKIIKKFNIDEPKLPFNVSKLEG